MWVSETTRFQVGVAGRWTCHPPEIRKYLTSSASRPTLWARIHVLKVKTTCCIFILSHFDHCNRSPFCYHLQLTKKCLSCFLPHFPCCLPSHMSEQRPVLSPAALRDQSEPTRAVFVRPARGPPWRSAVSVGPRQCFPLQGEDVRGCRPRSEPEKSTSSTIPQGKEERSEKVTNITSQQISRLGDLKAHEPLAWTLPGQLTRWTSLDAVFKPQNSTRKS